MRKLSLFNIQWWVVLPFTLALFIVFANRPAFSVTNNVTINEVLFDPAGTDTGNEWVELYNPKDTAINLLGFELNASSGDYYPFPDISLSPRSFITVFWGKDGVGNVGEIFTGKKGFGTIGNSKGYIAIFNSNTHSKSTIVDYLEWGGSAQTWEKSAVDAGIWASGSFIPVVAESNSLGLLGDGEDNDSKDDWKSYAKPTRGKKNDYLESLLTNILLSEFQPNPIEGNEWVELVNNNPYPVVISDWKIDDLKDGGSSPKSFSSEIEGNGFYKLDLGTKSFFNNSGDSVRLINSDGNLVEETSFLESESGFSYAKNSGGVWQETKTPTAGAGNLINSPIHELDIAEAKKLAKGSRVILTAFATSVPDTLGEDEFYIGDGVSGVKIRCDCDLTNSSFALGARIRVKGKVSESYGEFFIETKDVVTLERELPQVESKLLKTDDISESVEGLLVKLEGQVESLSDNGFYLNDGSEGSARVYYKDSTGVKRSGISSGDSVRALGIVSQHGEHTDGSPNYRVLSRYAGDVENISGTVLSSDTIRALEEVLILPITGSENDQTQLGYMGILLGLTIKLWVRRKLLSLNEGVFPL